MDANKNPDENSSAAAGSLASRKSAPELPPTDTPGPEETIDSATQPVAEPDLPEPDADADVPDDFAMEEPDAELNQGTAKGSKQNIFKRCWHGYHTHKKWTLPLTVLVILAVALAVPASRYPLLGTVVRRDFNVTVLDTTTHKPVTSAVVRLDGVRVTTNSKGQARLHAKVGHGTLTVEKKYYAASHSAVLVPIIKMQHDFTLFLKATGRQVPVVVTNSLDGKPIENALVRVADTEARTDKKGQAIVVVPADKSQLKVGISAEHYNDANATMAVTEQVSGKNHFKLTPAGKLYFLSNLSGKIDVVKTNLDGTDRSTVLAGTGNESNNDTMLLASNDWKYVALKSKRSDAPAKLYLINTATDKVTTIDEGDATFDPVGWVGDHFVYLTNRTNVQYWKPYAQALKTYDASSDKLVTIDQTSGEGSDQFDYGYTNFSNISIVNDELVYAKNWFASGFAPNHLDGKSVSLVSARADGSSKKTIKDFAIPGGTTYSYFVSIVQYQPESLYIQVPGNPSPTYYTYEAGKLTVKNGLTDDAFYTTAYPNYIISPSGTQAFWSEPRDGKNTLLVGDAAGKNGRAIATLSDYTPYGWYGDDYVLVSKQGSELYIMPVTGGTALKVTDYHKPAFNGPGGGYGYGGL